MKINTRKQFYLATATLVGTIIGVGIFSVPYAINQVGIILALVYIVVLGGLQLLQSLFYGEAAMACEEKVRLIGLTGRYMGPRWRQITAVASVLGFWGGLIAYILLGGIFLHLILSPWLGGSVYFYQLGWGLIGGLVVYFGLGFVEKIDFLSTVALMVALLAIIGLAIPHMEWTNIVMIENGDKFLPYGVILFSLSGLAAIPEMEDIMEGRHDGFRKAIILGTIIATVLTFLFAVAVYGVTGSNTTQDAISGLRGVMGNGVTIFAAVFGFLAVATSFFIIALNLKSSFEYDYKLHRLPAWMLAVAVPFGFVIMGLNNFIKIVGFSGAVFGGLTAVIVALLYVAVTKKKLLGKKAIGIPISLAYISVLMLIVGAIYEVYVTLVN